MGRIYELAHGALDDGEQLSRAEIRADLKQMGIDPDKSWAEVQVFLKQAEGRIRLAEAHEKRIKAAAKARPAEGATETVESLIAQIKGLLSLSGQAAVYARKWENSSIEDLKSLRDKLAKTAARAAERKNEGK
jgi:uncharacterized protein with von Willebrand factor type A (vWA) domain